MGLHWDDCKDAFQWDGSWRDLYVLNADRPMWERVVTRLMSEFECRLYFADGLVDTFSADKAFDSGPDDQRYELSCDVSGVLFKCYFFTEGEIELDVDPRDVRSADAFEGVLRMMKVMGDAAGSPVILTEENDQDAVWLRYLPQSGSFERAGRI